MNAVDIDFTVNTSPSRLLALTDWEARLVEHCIGFYSEAAITCADPSAPLAAAVLAKVRQRNVPADSTEKSRAIERQDEARAARWVAALHVNACEHTGTPIVEWNDVRCSDCGAPIPGTTLRQQRMCHCGHGLSFHDEALGCSGSHADSMACYAFTPACPSQDTKEE